MKATHPMPWWCRGSAESDDEQQALAENFIGKLHQLIINLDHSHLVVMANRREVVSVNWYFSYWLNSLD